MKLFLLLIFLFISYTSIFPQQDEWLTKFEKSNYLETARYEETMNYFQKLDDNSEYAKMFSFGVSPQGRSINCIVLSKDKAFTPADAKKTGKPVVMIINGIHSGEIEGKDACMMLLREILVSKEKANMLDNVIIVIVPIFSVDGHERFKKYNRINQNGPLEMGWRTTAQNLNLNRDWMKADAPEMQAMLKLFVDWMPDFFVDTHTTDGADYQYTVTYGLETASNVYKEIADMNINEFIPYLQNSVEKAGYQFAPYINFKDWSKGFESGLTNGVPPPRFSTAYMGVQNRTGLLVETHMLKPYKERVYSTKVVLESVINFCSEKRKELIAMNKRADENSIKQYFVDRDYYPLNFKLSDKTVTEKFKGKAFDKIPSEISGIIKTVYKDKDTVFDVTIYKDNYVLDSVKAPQFYLIPKEWKEIVEKIQLHGIKVDQLNKEGVFDVTKYKFSNVKYDKESFEGRIRVNFDVEAYKEKVKVPAGTYKISTNQRTIRVILNLLEPKADDSFIKWGFFNAIFEQKEYADNYIMEKVAEKMQKDDPALKKEFEKKLAEDETFRKDPAARLNFFYMRSPYWDESLRVYPVMRVE